MASKPQIVTPTGLSSAEAARRLAEHGPNTLPAAPAESGWRRFLRQFKSPLIYILLVALALDAAVWAAEGTPGLPLESIAIAVILLLNATLGVWQETKADAALAKLEELAAPQTWARRDGRFRRVPSAELVPGDVVRLEAGDRVPADLVAHRAERVLVDESVLTGESMPVEKSTEDGLAAGTLLVRGTTLGEVTRTGAASSMGRLATLVGRVHQEPTPLERRLRVFGHRVARWVVTLAAFIAIAGVAVEGFDQAGRMLLFAVALAVAAVPEGLPAILTVTLAIGVERMARRRAVVRKLSAVEALGSVTVIATDKTGTLTENRMVVRTLDTSDQSRALRAMVVANDAEPGTEAGDPMEVALLRHARTAGVEVESLRALPRVTVDPFDSDTKFMRVTVDEPPDRISYLKGAPEVLLERSRLSAVEQNAWREKIEAYAGEGYRILALAAAAGDTDRDLDWLGVVLLWDPPRVEVPDAVRAARAAGIRVVMITGDHPATALTVAKTVGIEAETVITGAELEHLDPDARGAVIRHTTVFARVTPEHKLQIVEALMADGDIVAVTGDGVNDAPALKRSDVGVAMGQRGSAVSRETADLVLLDDNFATIVAAIDEGRGIYENIQKFIRFLFSTNLSEVLVVTVGFLAAFALDLRDAAGNILIPLTAAQLLWINLVTDGAPALALGLDRSPGMLTRPPRDPSAPLLDRRSLRFVIASGIMKAALAFAFLGLLPPLGQSPETTRAAAFLFLATGQLVFTYPARHTDIRPARSAAVHWAVILSLAVQASVMFVPPLMDAFDTTPLAPWVWGMVAGAVLTVWVLGETASRIIWRRDG